MSAGSRPSPFEAVGEFHAAFGVISRSVPTLDVPPAELALRQDLLDEEVAELRAAVAAGDVVGVADALADIVYIACGTAHSLGVPFDEVFAEVHRANMSKLGSDGRPVLRGDGKVLKGPGYTPPDVAALIAAAVGGAGGQTVGAAGQTVGAAGETVGAAGETAGPAGDPARR